MYNTMKTLYQKKQLSLSYMFQVGDIKSCTEASKPQPHSWLGRVAAVTSMYRHRHDQTVTPGVPW